MQKPAPLFWQIYRAVLLLLTSVVLVLAGYYISHLRFLHLMQPSRDLSDQMMLHFAAVAFLVLVLASVGGVWLARRIARPLEDIGTMVVGQAAGEAPGPLPSGGSSEMVAWVGLSNDLVARWRRAEQQLELERKTREAVFNAMHEALLLVDARGRILHVNRAAERLLGIQAVVAGGTRVEEVVRQADVLRLLEEVQDNAAVLEREIRIMHARLHVLKASAALLRHASGKPIGTLIVMHDVTRLHDLEKVRQDFVANVSHELRTPITSIKGFVETLQDGGLDDPAAARRFVDIIARQADHMHAVVSDLLLVCAMENGSSETSIPREDLLLHPLLQDVLELCRHGAEQKQVQLVLDMGADLTVRLRPHLFEQAIVNLVDNAIKFSPSGARVQVQVQAGEGAVRVTVIDQGCGIERHHINRLFERFYRVDRGRSKALGGTGLGLSIVKHVATLHGGSVGVESVVGKGSRFWLEIPLG